MLGAPGQPGGAEGFHQDREFIAEISGSAPAGQPCPMVLKNRFFAGDTLELMTPGGVLPFTATPFIRQKTG